jgi:2-alkenal reductase
MSLKRVIYPLFVMLVAGASALGGAVVGGLTVYQMVSQDESSASVDQAVQALPVESQAQTLTVNTTDIENAITQTVQNIGPAVVTVVGTIPGQMTFFGRTQDSTVSGSGVFISENGYVLTNNHVVAGTTELKVILADGSEQEATIIGTDQYSDLAVLKVDGMVSGVAVLGDSDALKPGETVIAIGSALGDFMNTVTVGVVSATGRSIETSEGYQIQDLIQTDAAINQGNSGGPLVNLAGEVVGINTLIIRYSESGTVAEGLGFSIPSNTVRVVAEQIIQKGYFPRPYLGINWRQITPEIAARYRLPVDWGTYVMDVYANSPANEAGIQQGDIITRIGDVAINADHTFLNTILLFQPGEKVTVELVRDDKTLQVEVTLGEANSN